MAWMSCRRTVTYCISLMLGKAHNIQITGMAVILSVSGSRWPDWACMASIYRAHTSSEGDRCCSIIWPRWAKLSAPALLPSVLRTQLDGWRFLNCFLLTGHNSWEEGFRPVTRLKHLTLQKRPFLYLPQTVSWQICKEVMVEQWVLGLQTFPNYWLF